MNDLHHFCHRYGALDQLESITLGVPLDVVNDKWLAGVDVLLASSPLQIFHIYATGRRRAEGGILPLDEAFVKSFALRHGNSLKRFAVLRFPVTLPCIELLSNHTAIEELFIALKRTDLVRLRQ